MADYVLEIVEGPEAGRMIPLAGAVELGRDASCGRRPAAGRAAVAPPRADHARGGRRPGRGPRLPQRHLRGRRPDLQPGAPRRRRPAARRRHAAPAADGRDGRVRSHGAPADPRRLHDAAAAAGRRDRRRRRSARSRRGWPCPRSEPDYVPASALGAAAPAAGGLFPLLDVHTKGKAKGAPIGIFVLVAFARDGLLRPALDRAACSAK